MEKLIDYEFTPKINYFFEYEVDVNKSKEKITQIISLYEEVVEKELKTEENKRINIVEEQNVGYYVRDFLNFYKTEFKDLLDRYRKKLVESTQMDRLENGEILSINLLREFLYTLEDNKYSIMIGGDIIKCLWDLEHHIPKYKGSLYFQMDLWKNVQNFDDESQLMVNKFKKQIDMLEGKAFYDATCLRCMDNTIKKVEKVVDFWNNLFEINGEGKQTESFTGANLEIPKCEVKYIKDKTHPKPEIYTFNIYNLMELSRASIYMFDKVKPLRIIIKCKSCGDYFVPRRNNSKYCNKYLGKDKDGDRITCNRMGSSKQFGSNDIIINDRGKIDNKNQKFYHRLYNRLKGDKKREILREEYKQLQRKFKNDIENLNTEILREGYKNVKRKFENDREKLNTEINKLLQEWDVKSKKKNKGKRGRPYKN